MALTDDWGGIAVSEEPARDDWGGIAAPVTDDWGGIEVHEENAPQPAPDATPQLLPAPVGSGVNAWSAAGGANEVVPFVPRSRHPIREGNPIPKYQPTESERAVSELATRTGMPVVMRDGMAVIEDKPTNPELSTGEKVTQGIERGIGTAGMRAAEGVARLTGASGTADELGNQLSRIDEVAPLQGTAGKIGSGVGGAMALMSVPGGLKGVLGFAGAQAVAGGYDATYAEAKAAGKDEEASREDARKGAFKAALKSVPEMAAYWLLGMGAAKAIQPFVQQAPPLVKAVVGGAASTAANVTTSTTLHAIHGEPLFTPEGLAMDATFGFGAHGLAEGRKAAESEASVREHLSQAPIEALEAAAADPAFRKSAPYDPRLIDAEISARKEAAPEIAPLTAAAIKEAPAATELATAVPAAPLESRPLSTETLADTSPEVAIRQAYEQLKKQSGFPAVNIEQVAKQAGVPVEQVAQMVQAEAKAGNATLSADSRPGEFGVEHNGARKTQVRWLTEPPKVAEQAKPAPAIDPQQQATIREAYDRVKERTGFPAVPIAEVIRESGLPAEVVKEHFSTGADKGDVVLSLGDWSIANEAERAGVIKKGSRNNLQVRFLENAEAPPVPKLNEAALSADTPKAEQVITPDKSAAVSAPVESGAKLGPGAANIEEPLASYEQRRFSERFQDDTSIDPTVREQTGNRYYEPIPNKITVAEAEKIISDRGIDEGARLVRDESFPMEPRVRSTMAQGLIKKLNQSYAEAVKTGDPKAQRFLDQAVDTAEYLGELGTRLGQGVQSFAIWSRLSPEGMLVQAKRIVSKARTEFETTNGEAVKEIIDAVNAAPEGEKMKVLIKVSETNPVAKKVKGDFEAILAASKDGKLTKEQFYDKVSKKLGIPTLSPEDIAKITKMTAEIEKAPEGFQRDDKTRELLNYLSKLKGADASEVPTSLFYANILSGYTTQLVNTVDTAINVLSEASARAIANPGAAGQIFTGLYQGLLKGIPDAANVLKTGKGRAENKLQVSNILERSKFGEKGGVPINESTPLGRLLKAGFESKPASILNLWKYPLRAMMASDTVFYNSAKEARARVLAQAIGKSEGLTGDALFSRVDEILHNTNTERAQARQQATDEGLSGNAAKRRVSEILEQKRPEDLVATADEAAGIATYNHDPQGVLGVVAYHLAQAASKVPGGVFVVPFTRIVANVFNRGLDYTPWGYKRSFFGRGGGKRFEAPAPVGEEFKVQLVKATAGTIGMTAIALLDANGTIQVTGSGPSDPNEKKQLQAAGWKPYSVKIGDRYYSYQNTPLGVGLAMVGHYRDAVRYNKLEEKDAQTRLIFASTGALNTMTSMSFLSGLSDFMEMANGKGASSDGAKRFFQRTVSSIAVPNIIKQINRVFDPTLYQSDTLTQSVLRDTPAARTVSKPVLNVLGEPVKMSSNRFTSEATDDPVWKLIVEKQAWVPTPSKTTKIKHRPITPEEYYTLIEKSGPPIKEFIRSNLSRFKAMPAGDVQEEIQKRASEIRAGVKSRF